MAKLGGIIYKGKLKGGEEIIIRYPKMSDAKDALEFINLISREKSFLNIQGKKVTMKEELAFLRKNISGIRKKECIHLFVLAGNRIIGSATIDKETTDAQKHKGEFGIVISKNFRGRGIGKVLMDLTIKEAKKNIRGLEIITLKVFGNNPIALKLYKKLGFKSFGLLPNGVIHRNKRVDEISMYKKV